MEDDVLNNPFDIGEKKKLRAKYKTFHILNLM